MPKSTPMPMKRMAKATEIRLSVPTAAAAKDAVTISPTTTVATMARIRRGARNPAKRIASTTSAVRIVPDSAPSLTEANSSSSSGTSPVRRMRTPCSARCSEAAISRIVWLAAAPGCSTS